MFIETINFQGEIDIDAAEKLQDDLVKLSSVISKEIMERFPLLRPEAYKSSSLWLELVGTGMRPCHIDDLVPEVREIIREHIIRFLLI